MINRAARRQSSFSRWFANELFVVAVAPYTPLLSLSLYGLAADAEGREGGCP